MDSQERKEIRSKYRGINRYLKIQENKNVSLDRRNFCRDKGRINSG